jgi:hypothetical protein
MNRKLTKKQLAALHRGRKKRLAIARKFGSTDLMSRGGRLPGCFETGKQR